MILLLTLACLPDTFLGGASAYDPEEDCWTNSVTLTLDTTYWREWEVQTSEACPGDMFYYTADGLCMYLEACDDEAPFITDDPAWNISRETTLACQASYEGRAHPDCDPPITEWP